MKTRNAETRRGARETSLRRRSEQDLSTATTTGLNQLPVGHGRDHRAGLSVKPLRIALGATLFLAASSLPSALVHAQGDNCGVESASECLVTCGGEGEGPCGVLEEVFWANGSGFCDTGLKAVDFAVLPDIPAFRSQDWLDFSNLSLQVFRDIITTGEAIGLSYAEVFTLDPADWFSFGVVDSYTVNPCSIVGEDCTITVNIYGPVLNDAIIHHFALYGEFSTLLTAGIVDEFIIEPAQGQNLVVRVPNFPSFTAPSIDFDPLDFGQEIIGDIDTGSIENTIENLLNTSLNFVNSAVQPFVDLVNDFDDPPGTCVNHLRHNWDAENILNSDGSHKHDLLTGQTLRGNGTGDVAEFQSQWGYWALQNQRTLGQREPINWIQHIDTHNAYNTIADGYIFPNQRYSISDQLDLGARSIELDPNEYFGWLRVCHAKDDDVGCALTDRLFDNALKEVRNWLDANPNEVIILRMEDYIDVLDPFEVGILMESLEERLGDLAYGRDEFDDADTVISDVDEVGVPWPSIQKMRELEKQVIIIDYYNAEASGLLWPNPVVEESGDFFDEALIDPAVGQQLLCSPSFAQTADPTGDFDVQYAQQVMLGGVEDGRVSYYLLDANGEPIMDPNAGPDDPAPYETLGFLDKGFTALHEIVRVTESSPFLEALGGFPPAPPFEELVFIDEAKVELLRNCRATLISMDFAHGKPDISEDACDGANLDLNTCHSPDERFESAVWSWEEDDRGNNGDGAAFVTQNDGRWASSLENALKHAACARPREGDPRDWPDTAGAQWKVTQSVGTWREAGQMCLQEYGEDYVFSAPVIGWQNTQLLLASNNIADEDIWLNYNDIKVEGDWNINQRPQVQAGVSSGQPRPLKEGDAILFTTAGTIDPEGDVMTFNWAFDDNGSGVDATSTGPSPTHQYGDDTGGGAYDTTVNVDDGFGGVTVAHVAVPVINVNPQTSIDNVTDETGAEVGVEVPAALVGLSVDLAGSYSDVGWLDTHEATTNWGDGASDGPKPTVGVMVTVGSDVSGATDFSHIFSTPATNTMTLTVEDDDSGLTSPTRDILIVDAAGAIELMIQLFQGMPGAGELVHRLELALDKVLKSNHNAALNMIQKSVEEVAALELSGGEDLTFVKGFLSLASKSELVAAIDAALGNASSAQDEQKIADAVDLIAQADALLAQLDHVAATGSYLLAIRAVQGI